MPRVTDPIASSSPLPSGAASRRCPYRARHLRGGAGRRCRRLESDRDDLEQVAERDSKPLGHRGILAVACLLARPRGGVLRSAPVPWPVTRQHRRLGRRYVGGDRRLGLIFTVAGERVGNAFGEAGEGLVDAVVGLVDVPGGGPWDDMTAYELTARQVKLDLGGVGYQATCAATAKSPARDGRPPWRTVAT